MKMIQDAVFLVDTYIVLGQVLGFVFGCCLFQVLGGTLDVLSEVFLSVWIQIPLYKRHITAITVHAIYILLFITPPLIRREPG
jgi:hypothetical protein